ncbi:MAG: hypothetical protein DRM98_06595, partial [Thermoplasmata archaeon]
NSWEVATGEEVWSYQWDVPGDGTYTILSRVIDEGENLEEPGDGVTVTIDSNLPTTSGSLTEDETWSGTVVLTGDVTVPEGVALTIEPGTEVRFTALSDDQHGGEDSDRCELIVHGSLDAEGTESSPISFVSSTPNSAPGDWEGIKVNITSENESVKLSYCNISNSNTGLEVKVNGVSSTVEVDHCTVEHIAGRGIYIYGESGAKIASVVSSNTLSDIGGDGVYGCATGSGTEISGSFSGNTISDTDDAGIYLRASSYGFVNGEIEGNSITNAGRDTGSGVRYGVLVYTDNHGTSDIDVSNNSITTAGSYGIYVYNNTYATGNVDIAGNTVTGTTHGIYVYTYNYSSASGTIRSNTVHDNSGIGICVYSNSNYIYNQDIKTQYIITGNTVYNTNGHEGIYCWEMYSHMVVQVTDNEVHHASQGIYCRSYAWGSQYKLEALISANDVHDNSGDGIYCYEESGGILDLEIRGNLVYQNNGNGIVCTRNTRYTNYVSALITLNSVHQNGAKGIICVLTEPVRVIYNDVTENGGNGLELTVPGGSIVNYNNFYSNGGDYEIVDGNGANINAQFNYWGSAATSQMASGDNPKNISVIYDKFDDSTRGAIDYANWLTSAISLPDILVSRVTFPIDNTTFKASSVEVRGIAVSRNGVLRVEVSTDGGNSWEVATGEEVWSYQWDVPGDGTYTILSRVIDEGENLEEP